jgi:hypothetical protein
VTLTRVLLIAVLASPGVAAQGSSTDALLKTTHFAFYSDLATNVNDALVAAGGARVSKQPEPFASGPVKACLDGLPAAERDAWMRGVDYFATTTSTSFQRVMLRLELAGMVRGSDVSDAAIRKFLEEVTAIREAATPAYRACRWAEQDALNRRWIEGVKPLLDKYERDLGEQLPRLFQKPWQGLPFRVDVVQTAGFGGANSASPLEPTLHILVSSTNAGNQDRAALEVVFHEAVHFLTRSDSPLGMALASALKEVGGTPPRMDLVHGVHFFLTGEAVRRAYARAGEPEYSPYLYAQKLFPDQFREAAARIWPSYIDGARAMAQAAGDLARALTTQAKE